MYNPELGEYQIYDIDEFLTTPRTELMSVDQKMEVLMEEGLISQQSDIEADAFVEKNRNGIIIFSATTAAIVLLLVYLWEKKRRNDG